MVGLETGAIEDADGVVVEVIVGLEEAGPTVIKDFIVECFPRGGGCAVETIESLDPDFDIAMETTGGVGDSAEIDDGIEKRAKGDEETGDGIGLFTGENIDAERRGFGVWKKWDGEKTLRERGGRGEDGIGCRHGSSRESGQIVAHNISLTVNDRFLAGDSHQVVESLRE